MATRITRSTSIKRLFATLYILGVLGFGALFTHVNQAFASSCAPVDATAHGVIAFEHADPIDQVVASGSVNVRHGPGTSASDCIITTEDPTANVVVVPNTAQVWANNLWWTLVLYFQHNSRGSTNYSWTNAGWMASEFLTPATHGFQCFNSSGCKHFYGEGPPDVVENATLTQTCPGTSDFAPQCEDLAHNAVWSEPVPSNPNFPETIPWGARDSDPNWFIDVRINPTCESLPPDAQCPSFEYNSFWNWDWTAY